MAKIQPFFKGFETPNRKIPGATGCYACKLCENCITPKMEATGDCEKGIFILAEAPGATEDKRGIQLIGKSGQRLRRELERHGIDLDRDCRKMNAVNCRPPKNRTPTDKEIACCRSRVLAEIKKCNPKVILALGGPAMKSLCQHRAAFDAGFPPMANWEGECIPDQEFQAWIIPTWHPAFIERLDGNELYERRWHRSLKKVAEMAECERPEIYDFESMVHCIVNSRAAAKELETIYGRLCNAISAGKNPEIAFDYETTGLKPYIEGHEIVCCSLAYQDDDAISFILNQDTWPILYNILRHPKIGKMAHNIKFEHLWTKVRGWPQEKMGFQVRNWAWDSMLAAHILDNRTGKAGLKLQAYLRFGVLGYDDAAGPYIRTAKKDVDAHGANAFNRVKELPIDDLLLYCAYDSLFEYRLAKMQKKLVKEQGLQDACDLFFKGAIAFTEAEANGIRVDLDYYEKQGAYLARRIEQKKQKMEDYAEVKQWREMAGDRFKLSSAQQLSKLLYEELGIESKKQTSKGQDSVDKAVLEDMDLPFVQDLLEIRKLEKLKSTYVDGLKVEAPDGWLHPFFHLHKVVSYRSASSQPNFQNMPKRDKQISKIVRRGMFPKKGFCWFEVDYSGVEVRAAAFYHKDPNMIKYLNDPTTDMHRDTAADLCLLPHDMVGKMLRQSAKNGFVFPQFYGDWYVGCANNIWHKWFNSPDALLADGKTHIKKWLAHKGIKSYEDFEKHVHDVEDIFWKERFPVYDAWREEQWKEYQKRGYFWNYTGFRYGSIMNRKEATNYGIQGNAFHCLLWSFIQVTDKFLKEHWKSYLLGQIHDAMDGGAHPSEINALVSMVKGIMVDKLSQTFSWINVPIDVEFEMAPVNAAWYYMSEIKKRPQACDCGLEWGYHDKKSDVWTCPVCDPVQK